MSDTQHFIVMPSLTSGCLTALSAGKLMSQSLPGFGGMTLVNQSVNTNEQDD